MRALKRAANLPQYAPVCMFKEYTTGAESLAEDDASFGTVLWNAP